MTDQSQRRNLKAHPKLIMDVIRRQAGTLHKAVLEGVMNAIEAGADRVDITFNRKDGKAFLTISDNGKGIMTPDAIENFFETFGTPHDESEGEGLGAVPHGSRSVVLIRRQLMAHRPVQDGGRYRA